MNSAQLALIVLLFVVTAHCYIYNSCRREEVRKNLQFMSCCADRKEVPMSTHDYCNYTRFFEQMEFQKVQRQQQILQLQQQIQQQQMQQVTQQPQLVQQVPQPLPLPQQQVFRQAPQQQQQQFFQQPQRAQQVFQPQQSPQQVIYHTPQQQFFYQPSMPQQAPNLFPPQTYFNQPGFSPYYYQPLQYYPMGGLMRHPMVMCSEDYPDDGNNWALMPYLSDATKMLPMNNAIFQCMSSKKDNSKCCKRAMPGIDKSECYKLCKPVENANSYNPTENTMSPNRLKICAPYFESILQCHYDNA